MPVKSSPRLKAGAPSHACVESFRQCCSGMPCECLFKQVRVGGCAVVGKHGECGFKVVGVWDERIRVGECVFECHDGHPVDSLDVQVCDVALTVVDVVGAGAVPVGCDKAGLRVGLTSSPA